MPDDAPMLCDVMARCFDQAQRGRLPHLCANRRLVGFRSFGGQLAWIAAAITLR